MDVVRAVCWKLINIPHVSQMFMISGDLGHSRPKRHVLGPWMLRRLTFQPNGYAIQKLALRGSRTGTLCSELTNDGM